MSFRASLLAALLFSIFSLTACGSRDGRDTQSGARTASPSPTATIETPPADGVRRVTITELRDALAKNEAIVVDVRGTVEYKLGHITGARLLPLGLVASRAGELPRDKLIVTYCA